MTTPPGQEPRPGFTPRGGQARPASRGGASGWPDDSSWRDEPATRRTNADSQSRAAGGVSGSGGSRDPGGDLYDYRADGRRSSSRPASGGRPPTGSTFREPGWRGRLDRPGGTGRLGGDGRDPRDDQVGHNGLGGGHPRRGAPSFSPAGPGATRSTGSRRQIGRASCRE